MQDKWGVLATRIAHERYLMPGEDWHELAHRVASSTFSVIKERGGRVPETEVKHLVENRKFLPGGRYLYSCGREFHQTQNCLLKIVGDSRESWGEHIKEHMLGLSTGAGMGTVYSQVREKNTPLKRTGGVSSGPVPLMRGTNDFARPVRQGGARRAALWAGLHWWHPDSEDFITAKNWSQEITRLKAENWEFPAPLDMTNISTCLDDEFFEAYAAPFHPRHEKATSAYWANVRNMVYNGDPGFSIDVGENAGECLRNACTEVSSRDDSDICNIGSINIGRYDRLSDFKRDLPSAVAFLLAGSEYSDVPYEKVRAVREKNRRLGLGLMGIHGWLLRRGKKYGPDPELGEWLAEYAKSTEIAARLADEWGISRPVKTRAMAPNGTIGLVAEVEGTCMEPILTVASKRRVKKGDRTWAQYVVDPAAQRLIDQGVAPDKIETAYSLSSTLEGIERRVAFQAWFQQYVDHGIASTINMSSWGSVSNNEDTVRPFGEMLLKYLPKLRGITVYPDGARSGQPIVPVSYETAIKHGSEIAYESADVCDMRGGSCG